MKHIDLNLQQCLMYMPDALLANSALCCICLSSGSNYAYTTLILFASSVARGCKRNKTLRAAGLSTESANYFEMEWGNIFALVEQGAAPLLKLANSLEEKGRNVQVTKYNGVVVLCNFELNIANFFAPDHLLSGKVECLVSARFALAWDFRDEKNPDIYLCDTLQTVGVHENSTAQCRK